MLWTLAIESVRQQENQSVLNIPFCLTGSEELVNYDLSTICEITELGFPKTKGVRVSLSVSIFKSKNCELRKMGAGCNELPDLITRANSLFNWAIVAILVLVEDMSVPM